MTLSLRQFVFLLLYAFLVSALPVSATPVLAGTYKITENTDLGSEVRITVELHLVNASDISVTITSVAVRSISSPLHAVSAPANLIVEGRSRAETTVQFLIPKKDFATWSAGPHQKFLVKFHSADEKPALANVLLLQTKG
jgi:uncharacterized protein (DUF58 family)